MWFAVWHIVPFSCMCCTLRRALRRYCFESSSYAYPLNRLFFVPCTRVVHTPVPFCFFATYQVWCVVSTSFCVGARPRKSADLVIFHHDIGRNRVEPRTPTLMPWVNTDDKRQPQQHTPLPPSPPRQTYIAALEKQLRTYKNGGGEPPRPPPSPASGVEAGGEEGSPGTVAAGATEAAAAAAKEAARPPQDEEAANAIRLLTKRNHELQAEVEEEKAEVKRRCAFAFVVSMDLAVDCWLINENT